MMSPNNPSDTVHSTMAISDPDLSLLILNALPDAVHIIDENLRILACNEAMIRFLQLSGYDGPVIGRTLPEAFPFLRESIFAIYQNIFASGAGSEEDEQARMKDKRIVIETTRIPIFKDNQVVYVVTVIHEITKRIRIQNELTRKSRVLEAVNAIISISARITSEEELCREALDQVIKLLSFDAGGIYRYDSRTHTGTLTCHYNLPKGFYEEVQISHLKEFSYYDLLINGVGIFSDQYSDINPDRAARYGINAIASIPIMGKSGLVRILNIISFRQYHFSEEEKELLRAIGIEIGNALDSIQAQRELVIQQQNTTNLVDSLWDMILIIANDGKIIGANQASALVLGYESAQLEGLMLESIITDSHVRHQMLHAGTHGSPRVFKARLFHRDGHQIETEVVISSGRWDREPVSIAVIRDRTLIAQAEERLKESEERHRLLLERLPDYILVVRDGVILYVNPAAAVLIKNTTESGQNIYSYILPEYHETVRIALARTIPGERTGSFEIKISLDEKVRTVLVNAVSIKYGDKPADLIVLTDITERKQAESEMMNHARVSGITGRIISIIHRAGNITTLSSQSIGIILKETGIRSGVIFLTGKSSLSVELVYQRGVPKALLALIEQHHISVKSLRKIISDGNFLTLKPLQSEYPLAPSLPSFSSVISVPLLSGMDITGVMHLFLSEEQVQDPVLVEVLPSVGRELGTAIARLRNQDDLQSSEANLQMLFRSITDMVFVIRTDGVVVAINDAVKIALGFSEEMMVGRTLDTCPDDVTTHARSLVELITSGNEGGKIDLIRKDESTLTGEVRITSGLWNGEEVRFCVVRDISEQVFIEFALRQSEERFRAIFEQASIGMVLTDASYHIIQTNEYFQQMIGYSARELFGRHISDLTLAEDYEKELDLVNTLTGNIKSGSVSLEKRYIHKNGTIIWSLIRMIALTGEDGKIIGVIGAVLDISRTKKADDALKSALKKLNLLSSITRHDILNQLTGVIGYNEIISMMSDDEGIAQYLDKQRKAAETIKHQIEFTRYYEDLGVNEPGWFVVDHLVARAVSRLDLKGIRIATNTDSISVYADPLIETVIYNLIENAVRYSEKATTITIAIEPGGGDGSLLLVLSDDGIGVTPGDKEKIFRRGYGKNTGFGLFLAKEVLNITGLTIHENGIPGKGARFEIMIPLGMYQ